MTRDETALDVAKRAYNAAMKIINGESEDLGQALASCVYVSHWLQAETGANALLGVRSLASVTTDN